MKVGIIGCGKIARSHANVLNKVLSGSSLHFCDRNQDKRDRLAGHFPKAKAYASVDELLRVPGLTAVHVLTQIASHRALAEQALESGMHVYVEKPVVETAGEYRQLQALAHSRQRILCPGYSTLGMPVVRRARSVIEGGQYGRLLTVHCDLNSSSKGNEIPYGSADHWVYSLRGGVLQNLVDHPLSVIVDAMDEIKDQRVLFGRRNPLPRDCPDLIHGAASNDHQMGSFTMSFGHGNAHAQATYFLEEATLHVDLRRQLFSIVPGRGPLNYPRRISTGLQLGWNAAGGTVANLARTVTGALPKQPGISALVRNFYGAIEGREQLIVRESTAVTQLTLLEKFWKEKDLVVAGGNSVLTDREADICIVGAGVAGAIIARRCVEAGLTVLMLEAGGRVKGRGAALRVCERLVRDYRIARMKLFRRARYARSDFESVGPDDYDLSGKALAVRGGSTLAWGGDAYRLQPEDFRRHTATGRGLDWPIGYEDLEPYYTQGERTLRVAGDHLDGGHPPRSGIFPRPARTFQERDRHFLELLRDQRWPAMHHPLALAADGGAFTADALLDELEGRPDFRLLTNSPTQRILGSKRSRIDGVEFVDGEAGQASTARASTVVVCAGGIETPNLLRRSTNPWWPEGLGNDSGHVGRHLISHLGLAFGGRPRGLRWVDGVIGPTAATRHFDSGAEQGEGKYLLLWRPAPSGYLFLNANLEQFPETENSVRPGSSRTRFGTPAPVIHFDRGELDSQRERACGQRLEHWAKQIGLAISLRRHFVLAHPMGTARMSAHPREGVLDRDLRVHSIENLYVCGSACFPTGGAANPTLTIAALAHRLGDHLSGNRAS